MPDQSMFAYKYFRGDLLDFAQKDVPLRVTKRVLRDCLRGITEMHEKRIVHTDIKPNNIVLDWAETARDDSSPPTIFVDQVQIADLESATELPEEECIHGVQLGNPMWCSPEAYAADKVDTPTDIFSFGIVVSIPSCTHLQMLI